MWATRMRRGSGNKVILIVLAVVGGVGLVVVLACAGCGIWAFKSITKDIPPAQASADAFLDDLKAGRTDAAYGSASSSFKTTQTLEQFREFVNRFDTLKTQITRSTESSRLFQGTGGKKVTLKMTLQSPNNAMSCTLIMVEENGQWKVERLSVP
jgi:hypothetical protein